MRNQTESVFADIQSCATTALFSLEVLDDSMEPEFPVGCIVVIDPAAQAKNGSFVLVENDHGLVMRQFWVRAGRQYLRPLNDSYHTIRLISVATIKGVVTQRNGKRRADKKFYS